MTNTVLDTSAILAYFNDEKGADRIERVLLSRGKKCHMHAANAIEVYYKVSAKSDDQLALTAYDRLSALGITIHESMDREFQLRCGMVKAAYPMLSLADSMVLVLAERIGGVVMTADKEFSKMGRFVAVEQIR